MTKLSPLKADRLEITLNKSPKQFDSPKDLAPNSSTDYILQVDYTDEAGWDAPKIGPFGPLQIDPTASVLHYAVECFEGLKLYKNKAGNKLILFRPELNMARLNDSCERIGLPRFDEAELLKCLIEYVKLEGRFVAPGGFIYLRPTAIGTNGGLGLKAPTAAKVFVCATMMQAWNAEPLKLYCSDPKDAVRAWPGGFGYAKLGANYGPTLQENSKAVGAGYHQVLWLYDEDKKTVTEAGGSNFFVAIKKKDSDEIELMTCPISTKLILPGISRRSALEYLGEKHKGSNVTVHEREFGIDEIAEAAKENRLVEAFAIGTAFFVAPVQLIRTPEGELINVPLSQGDSGDFAADVKAKLTSIMYGEEENDWATTVDC
ncbi:aminotransferase [Yarrowia lipolytica]|jgi:branched-chain amino acid aminotransferase|uniref:Branched-chain-amino-acid aminotransferase n=2 Tax=Yarrowia lipolytica TaxID=4952 RepID=Q6C120_YARLI|nr:YALI0F19910p [Yarrowia lipolytica CLIB122]AOW07448.1 hypothetical protein YALI1_F26574g [Yarrowia lipolytica]KAB8286506.1 aminotransferase [Yarrowia lipolytica]KAE8173550.1 aminotransferase [Yarrowia lipolytica]KAJ8055477.1 aminotransferase [Yarrowia lipolytica]QNP99312.1 Branched-chain-amino-acid aminotransferase atnH [Yarrowia lipolytica]|eukprot:XP_505642.1 YALI0F19910p [Yarrowia lipolytica CLIB122]